MRDHISIQYNPHIIPSVRDRILTGAEKVQHGIKQEQESDRESDAQNHIQDQHIPQYLIRPLIIFLPQLHGNQRRGTDSHQRTEGGRQVHQRKGQG